MIIMIIIIYTVFAMYTYIYRCIYVYCTYDNVHEYVEVGD